MSRNTRSKAQKLILNIDPEESLTPRQSFTPRHWSTEIHDNTLLPVRSPLVDAFGVPKQNDQIENVFAFPTSSKIPRSPPGPDRSLISRIESPQSNRTLQHPLEGEVDQQYREVPSQSAEQQSENITVIAQIARTHPLPQATGYQERNHEPIIHQFASMDPNITISQAIEAVRTPSVPKFISPDIFNPATSNPIAFIRSYERAAIANGWSNILKINYLGSFLEGAANIWYTKYLDKTENANKQWRDIAADFTKEYGGEQCLRKLKFKLNTRRQQDNEDIKSYFYDLVTIANEYDSAMSPESFRDHFENGLHHKHLEMYYLMSHANMSVDDIKTIVLKISDLRERTDVA